MTQVKAIVQHFQELPMSPNANRYLSYKDVNGASLNDKLGCLALPIIYNLTRADITGIFLDLYFKGRLQPLPYQDKAGLTMLARDKHTSFLIPIEDLDFM